MTKPKPNEDETERGKAQQMAGEGCRSTVKGHDRQWLQVGQNQRAVGGRMTPPLLLGLQDSVLMEFEFHRFKFPTDSQAVL
jgi:hypothetical protein